MRCASVGVKGELWVKVVAVLTVAVVCLGYHPFLTDISQVNITIENNLNNSDEVAN